MGRPHWFISLFLITLVMLIILQRTYLPKCLLVYAKYYIGAYSIFGGYGSTGEILLTNDFNENSIP